MKFCEIRPRTLMCFGQINFNMDFILVETLNPFKCQSNVEVQESVFPEAEMPSSTEYIHLIGQPFYRTK